MHFTSVTAAAIMGLAHLALGSPVAQSVDDPKAFFCSESKGAIREGEPNIHVGACLNVLFRAQYNLAKNYTVPTTAGQFVPLIEVDGCAFVVSCLPNIATGICDTSPVIGNGDITHYVAPAVLHQLPDPVMIPSVEGRATCDTLEQGKSDILWRLVNTTSTITKLDTADASTILNKSATTKRQAPEVKCKSTDKISPIIDNADIPMPSCLDLQDSLTQAPTTLTVNALGDGVWTKLAGDGDCIVEAISNDAKCPGLSVTSEDVSRWLLAATTLYRTGPAGDMVSSIQGSTACEVVGTDEEYSPLSWRIVKGGSQIAKRDPVNPTNARCQITNDPEVLAGSASMDKTACQSLLADLKPRWNETFTIDSAPNSWNANIASVPGCAIRVGSAYQKAGEPAVYVGGQDLIRVVDTTIRKLASGEQIQAASGFSAQCESVVHARKGSVKWQVVKELPAQ